MALVDIKTDGNITHYIINQSGINVAEFVKGHEGFYKFPILLHELQVEGNPEFRFGEEPREVQVHARYTPLKESSSRVYVPLNGEVELDSRYSVKSGKRYRAWWWFGFPVNEFIITKLK